MSRSAPCIRPRCWREYQYFLKSKYHKVHGQIIEERLLASDKERKTRYADASYKFEPMVSVHIPELKVLWKSNYKDIDIIKINVTLS